MSNLPRSEHEHQPHGLSDLPTPLRVALVVAMVEAVAYFVIGLVEWAATDWDKAVVALSTGLFFVVFGAFLAFCVWRVSRGEVWARSPIVMVQVIQIPVALSFLGGGWTTGVAIALLVVSVVTLVGVFHPASLQALSSDE